jgi:hypothetical protein
VNLYAYVGNDPVNLIDPTGLKFESSQTSEERKDGTRLTTRTVTFTAALNVDGGNLNGSKLADLAAAAEAAFESNFSGEFTDLDGNTTKYVFDAQISTGSATGSQHQLSILANGDQRLGAGGTNIGLAPGYENGKQVYLNDRLLDGSLPSNYIWARTVSHEIGHKGGLRHSSYPQNLMRPSATGASGTAVSRSQRQSIFERFQPTSIYRNPYTGQPY